MFAKKQKRCIKRTHLVTDDGLYDQKVFYKVEIVFIHPLCMMTNLSNISKRTFWRSLYGMVVYKVLKSKVEMDLAFFLTLILFSLVTIGKEFCTTQPRVSCSLNKRRFCCENFQQY